MWIQHMSCDHQGVISGCLFGGRGGGGGRRGEGEGGGGWRGGWGGKHEKREGFFPYSGDGSIGRQLSPRLLLPHFLFFIVHILKNEVNRKCYKLWRVITSKFYSNQWKDKHLFLLTPSVLCPKAQSSPLMQTCIHLRLNIPSPYKGNPTFVTRSIFSGCYRQVRGV